MTNVLSTDDDLLNQQLEKDTPASPRRNLRRTNAVQACSDAPESKPSSGIRTTFDFVQWSAEPNESFRPSGRRCQTLPSGVYSIEVDERGLYFHRKKIITDDLIELDDCASIRVLASIRKFWQSKEKYVQRGIVYKRGSLLWGPAGSGKTATLMLLMQELLDMDGIVVICENPKRTNQGLQDLRRIEPDRPLIVIMEDIEELINEHGEHDILAILDGENQVANVVNIATTNYPEILGARIVNRPSRFDERIFVNMPNERARERYIRHATREEKISEPEILKWVTDTKGFSVAHLRELVVAVFCLDQIYADVVERLKAMRIKPKSTHEFGAVATGFSGD
jgi:hypothetical protein